MSKEVVTIFTLLAVFFTLQLLMPFIVTTLRANITFFGTVAATTTELDQGTLNGFFMQLVMTYLRAAMIPLLVCGMVAVIVTMAQTKMLFSPKAFAFKAERMSPIKGFKKMFSIRSLVELIKSILKISVILYVLYSVISREIEMMPRMMDMTYMATLARTGSLLMDIVLRASLAFIALASLDYLYQWWQYEKNMRMSKQEIKDEYKQTEGDPQVKSRIRSIQQQRARKRMMQNVPGADVVVRNPTHFAVAIKYEPAKNRAPIVVAKGMDSLALQIIRVAEEHDVVVTENIPLARALYESADLDAEIPEQYYKAIAEVLAYVYNLKKKKLK